MSKDFIEMDTEVVNQLNSLKGPVFILGAGGFIGINLLNSIIKYRDDAYGVSLNPKNNWRFMANKIPSNNLISCNLNDINQVRELINQYKPRTVFNLAAYGAYSRQKEYKTIYSTNFNANIDFIEILKEYRFSAYINAGSSSEYGLNSAGPGEGDELIPNSHYAVSKVSSYYALKYYGKVEKLPTLSLRLYSAFGPWEEPDRLIPTIIRKAKKNQLPDFVDPSISRDFIHVDDVVSALVTISTKIKKEQFGDAFNICSGKKTTIGDLANLVKKLFKIKKKPLFSTMQNKSWDIVEWYGNPKKINNEFKWKAKIGLEEGLRQLFKESN